MAEHRHWTGKVRSSREYPGTYSIVQDSSWHGDAENIANVRLIETAPELLRALEAVIEFVSPYPMVEEGRKALAQARVAVAKAKGGSNA